MKLKALAPAALILFSGYALAQDASKDKYDADKAAAPAQTQQQSSSKAATPSTAQSQSSSKAATPSTAQKGAQSQGNSTASASATTNVTFATADSDKDGKLSIAEMKVVMPDVTIIDVDSDGYVNQKEAEASITGLTFTAGSDTALITEQTYSTIVAARDDDDLELDLDDDADVEIKVEGDVEVEDTDN
jgi:cytoskeletal protein RodZ